MDTKCIL